MDPYSASIAERKRADGVPDRPPIDILASLRLVRRVVSVLATFMALGSLLLGSVVEFLVAGAIAIAAWPTTRGAGLRRFRDLGYDRVSAIQWTNLEEEFGSKALRRLPRWDDLRVIPRVDGENQFIAVRGALALFCWNRDPRHLPLLERGYWGIDDEAADALVDAFPIWSIRLLPFPEALYRRGEKTRKTQFEHALAILEERHQAKLPDRERLLARARGG